MPMRRAVLITRHAISPRLAIRIFENMGPRELAGRAANASPGLNDPRTRDTDRIRRRLPARRRYRSSLRYCKAAVSESRRSLEFFRTGGTASRRETGQAGALPATHDEVEQRRVHAACLVQNRVGDRHGPIV